jgi:hypothetical protein
VKARIFYLSIALLVSCSALAAPSPPPSTPGQLTLTPASIAFPPQAQSTFSSFANVVVTNVGVSPVRISSVSGTDLTEFPGSSTCITTLGVGASCTISAQFIPLAAGVRTETITVTSNGIGSPQSLEVSGIGLPLPGSENYQGLWFNPAESGWGINFAHQGDLIFASWFTYDLTGKGTWLVMTAAKTTGTTYSGQLFQGTGPAYDAVPFPPLGSPGGAVVGGLGGTGTVTFSDANNATFSYTVAGITQTKTITRELLGAAAAPVCVFGAQANLALAGNYTDLWWASPPGSEAGWGVNLTHQGSLIFASWFTFDHDHTPMWLVATAAQTAANTYTATQLFRLTGPAFNAVPFPPLGAVGGPTGLSVGTMQLVFSDGNTGMFTYTINGIPASKAITREVFNAPGTVCQ